MAVPDRLGRYRVTGVLGIGGFSTVFSAVDEALEVEVAVKVLADNLTTRADVVAQFLAEARLLRTISDRHIVAVHDVGVLDSGQPYLVMDLVAGSTLEAELRDSDRHGAPVAAEYVVGIGIELADSVAALAKHGLVHGDLKPANVIVTETSPRVFLLTDFGLARDGSGVALPGAGTPGYVAPEQTRGERTDVRADLYSCTAILYRIIEGSPPPATGPWPFRRASTAQQLFLRTGSATFPDERPPSAAAWLTALRDTLRPVPATLPPKRRGRTVWLTAAAVAVGAGVTARAVFRHRTPDPLAGVTTLRGVRILGVGPAGLGHGPAD